MTAPATATTTSAPGPVRPLDGDATKVAVRGHRLPGVTFAGRAIAGHPDRSGGVHNP